MSSTAKRFTAAFALAGLLALFLNVLPFLLTRGSYHGDGFEVIGFPFTFRRLGGIQGLHEFRVWALLIDITLSVAAAIAAGYTWAKFRHRA